MLEKPAITRTPLVQLAGREEELEFMQNLGWQVEVDRAHRHRMVEDARPVRRREHLSDVRVWRSPLGRKKSQPPRLEAGRRSPGMAQLRIVRPTPLKFGMAYLRWGPLWERRGLPLDPEVPARMAPRHRE